MNVRVGIDTSTERTALAVESARGVRETVTTGGASESLLGALQALLAEAGAAPAAIAEVVVGVGPGSFTGLRVGVTTAKLLAFATKAPLVAVSSLEVVAHGLVDEVVCVAADARKGQLYAAAWSRAGALIVPEGAFDPDVLAATLTALGARSLTVAGTGVAAYHSVFAALPRVTLCSPERGYPSGAAVLAVGRGRAPVDPHTLAPNYLRPADAKLPAR